jgi:hypothetical protein
MRMTGLGVASLLSMSLAVGCSTSAPPSAQSVGPGPILREGDDHPTSPGGPACLLCPTAFGVRLDAGVWTLAGRPDPVDIAGALGAPELTSSISDRIVDTEAALADVPATDGARAKALAAALAHDLDALTRAL